jgi:hypothetical protein
MFGSGWVDSGDRRGGQAGRTGRTDRRGGQAGRTGGARQAGLDRRGWTGGADRRG